MIFSIDYYSTNKNVSNYAEGCSSSPDNFMIGVKDI